MTMTNKMQEQDQRTGLLLITLLVSVSLNLFLGVWMGFEPGMKGGKRFAPLALANQHGDLIEDRLTRYLDPADTAAFHASMDPQLDALRQAHMHMREATRDVAAIYEKDPMDPAALQTALDNLKRAKAEVDDVSSLIIQNSYAKLSPEGRHRLAEMTR